MDRLRGWQTTEHVLDTGARSALTPAFVTIAAMTAATAAAINRAGPTFDNSIGIGELDGRHAEVTIFRAEPGEDADALQPLHTRVLAHGPRSGGHEPIG
jgi:hypothetical protein